MIRTGITTSEGIGEALENAGTPLSYGATAESWRAALTTLSGNNTEITERETEGATGWSSDNATILKSFNDATTAYTVDIIFLKDSKPIEVESVTLNGIEGVFEGEDHYEFANIEGELVDVELKYTLDGVEYIEIKSYSTYTDDIVIVG